MTVEEKKEKLYSFTYELKENRYDADNEEFQANLFDNIIYIPVPREKARAIRNRNIPMIMKGRLRYHDIQYAELVDGVLLDGEGNEEFPLSTKKR